LYFGDFCLLEFSFYHEAACFFTFIGISVQFLLFGVLLLARTLFFTFTGISVRFVLFGVFFLAQNYFAFVFSRFWYFGTISTFWVSFSAKLRCFVFRVYPFNLLIGGGKQFGGYMPYTPFNGTSTLWDLQASYIAYTAMILGSPLPSPFPYFTLELLPIMVTDAGHTVISKEAKQLVAAAVKYATTWENAIPNVEVDTVASIIALKSF
jgi:hypothetical protein